MNGLKKYFIKTMTICLFGEDYFSIEETHITGYNILMLLSYSQQICYDCPISFWYHEDKVLLYVKTYLYNVMVNDLNLYGKSFKNIYYWNNDAENKNATFLLHIWQQKYTVQ